MTCGTFMLISVGGKQDYEAVGRMLIVISVFFKNRSISFFSPLKCTKLQLASWDFDGFFLSLNDYVNEFFRGRNLI